MKTTRWFSSMRRRPQMAGLYEVQTKHEDLHWSWWDGSHWNGAWGTKQSAEANLNWFGETGGQGVCTNPFKWRGLMEPA